LTLKTLLKPGDLVVITRKPYDSPDAKTTSFWCEALGMNCEISVGTVVLIIDNDKRSAVKNPLVHFILQNTIYSIIHYDDQLGNPLWCEIINQQ